MKRLLLLGFIIIYTSCSEKKSEILERKAFLYYSGEPKTENYDVEKRISENEVFFKYKSQKDSSRIIPFRFKKIEKELFLDNQSFISSRKDSIKFLKLSESAFYYYFAKEHMDDGPGPILFNEEYGVLGVYNGLGPTVLYLKNSELPIREKVLKALLKE